MLQFTVWSRSFNLFNWEVFLERTNLPVAQGVLPSTFKAHEGSRVILWWRYAFIISPRYHKEVSRGPIEDREVGETL